MKKVLIVMGLMSMCLVTMACSHNTAKNAVEVNTENTEETQSQEASPLVQRGLLYDEAYDKGWDWHTEQWIAFQKKDLAIATLFYGSNPSVADVSKFEELRKQFLEKIELYNIDEDAYFSTIPRGSVARWSDVLKNDAELISLADQFVRVHNPWYKANGKALLDYEGVIVEEVVLSSQPTPEQKQQQFEFELSRTPDGFKEAFKEGFYFPFEW